MTVTTEMGKVEYVRKLEAYEKGYRIAEQENSIGLGDIVLAVVAEDSFIIGRVLDDGLFYNLRIMHQLGATYHNIDKNKNILVNDFEIYEVLDAIQ